MADPFAAAACRALAALAPPPRLLLAVSGGADSVALLDALWSGRNRRDLKAVSLAVGHFDHRLRANSGDDRELVASLASERGLPFLSREADHLRPLAGGLEEAARHARYGALQEIAGELGCTAIVTAHTATDQAETLLWRLARGTGMKGLGAMRPSRKLGPVRLLRPLLAVTREETRAYCLRRGIRFHDDPTNVDHRPRARLRAEVLPVLERLAPGAVRRLAAASDRLREDDDYLEALASQVSPAYLEALASQVSPAADIHSLAALPRPVLRRVLIRWAAAGIGSRRRLSARHVEALEVLVLKGSGEVELPSSADSRCVATVEDSRLTCRTLPPGSRGVHRFGANGV